MRLRGKILTTFVVPLIIVGAICLAAIIWLQSSFSSRVMQDVYKVQATLEMEISVHEAVRHAMNFLVNHNEAEVEGFNQTIDNFNHHYAIYKRFDASGEEHALINQLKSNQDKFVDASHKLFADQTKQASLILALKSVVNGKVDDLFANKWDKSLNDSASQAVQKILLEVDINIHKLLSATISYVLRPNGLTRLHIEDSSDGLHFWLNKLKANNLSADQEVYLKQLTQYSARSKQLVENIIDLQDKKYTAVNAIEQHAVEMDKLLDDHIQTLALSDMASAQDAMDMIAIIVIAVTLIVLVASVFAVLMIVNNQIVKPIGMLKHIANEMAEGETEIAIEMRRDDEVGELAHSFQAVCQNAKQLARISKRLGKGEFDVKLKPRSERDVLGHALLTMRNNLQTLDQAGRQQVWIKTQVSDITQAMQGMRDVRQLLQATINELADRLEAGFAAFYLKQEHDESAMLKLLASYAYVERKNLANEFMLGESLVGQCALEKQMIVLNKIPDDYIRISSGLGEEKPRQIIVLPVLHDDELIGVLELASFEIFTDERREVLQQVTQSLGIVINNVQAHEKTQILLKKSQEMAEELRAQQDELKATNEELEEKAKILKESEDELKAQSEELQATNEELEEKTERLQSQNKDIERQNSEIESARSELEQRAKDLSLASKYKSEFLANMSHELRTPLNSLLILSKNLEKNKDGNLTDKQIESAHVIRRGGEDLLRLINDILDLSKVEAGKLRVEVAEFSLKEFFREIHVQFEPIMQEKALEFSIDIASDVPVVVTADKQRLAQIIKNLLFNAVKFTNEGKISIDVVRSASIKHGIDIRVTDTGIGIAADKQRAIFEAFHQGDGSTSRKYGGTGLGLAISRAMTELLGGEISVSSTPGKGSVFTLSIPSEADISLEAESKESVAEQSSITKSMVSEELMVEDKPLLDVSNIDPEEELTPYLPDDRETIVDGDVVVLLVEDDKDFIQVLMEYAHDKGYKCLAAGDGHTALVLAKRYLPTAIILDLGLPDLDGIQVLEQLKFDLKTRHIPVHVVSGRDETFEVKQKGAIGFLTKPVSEENLADVFSRLESISHDKVKRILIVEDDESNQKAVQDLVSSSNIVSDVACSAERAKQCILENDYGCVILDLTLPDYSGFELMRQLSDMNAQLPPIVVYTGRELTQEEHSELQRYANSIVLKGVETPERLLDEISLFLHSVENDLPPEQRTKLNKMHDPEQLLKGRRVLLVDDDMRNVFALSSVLEEYGLDVIIASNGQVALDKLESENNIELVMMDIMMPVMDGYEAMKRIREMPPFKIMPIIALTAKAMAGDREKCLQAGATDYITKPIDVDQLIALIKVWLFRQ